MDITLKALCILSAICLVITICLALYIHNKSIQERRKMAEELGLKIESSFKLAQQGLAAKIEASDQRLSEALGEWSAAMGKHVAEAMRSQEDSIRIIQESSRNLHEILASNHSTALRTASEKFEEFAKDSADRHDRHITALIGAIDELGRRMAKGEESNRELYRSLDELKQTLTEAVKL